MQHYTVEYFMQITNINYTYYVVCPTINVIIIIIMNDRTANFTASDEI